MVRSCGEEEFFSTNWLSIFNDFSNIKTSEWDLYPQGFSSVERGRKRAHSLVSTQSSSSTRSHEYGRKSFRNNKNDNYSSDMENDNLLLNLEQINEDLEDGHYIEENSQGNILDFNLNLPPSSFGRSHTRNSTRSSGFNEDIVGALRRRVGPSEQNFAEEDDSSNSCFLMALSKICSRTKQIFKTSFWIIKLKNSTITSKKDQLLSEEQRAPIRLSRERCCWLTSSQAAWAKLKRELTLMM